MQPNMGHPHAGTEHVESSVCKGSAVSNTGEIRDGDELMLEVDLV